MTRRGLDILRDIVCKKVQLIRVTQASLGFDTRAIEMPYSHDMTCSIAASVDCRKAGPTHVELCPGLPRTLHYWTRAAHIKHKDSASIALPLHESGVSSAQYEITSKYIYIYTAILNTFQVVRIQKLHCLLDKDLHCWHAIKSTLKKNTANYTNDITLISMIIHAMYYIISPLYVEKLSSCISENVI